MKPLNPRILFMLLAIFHSAQKCLHKFYHYLMVLRYLSAEIMISLLNIYITALTITQEKIKTEPLTLCVNNIYKMVGNLCIEILGLPLITMLKSYYNTSPIPRKNPVKD